jgi:hypothetical protein
MRDDKRALAPYRWATLYTPVFLFERAMKRGAAERPQ